MSLKTNPPWSVGRTYRPMQPAGGSCYACPVHVGVPGVNGGQGNPVATVNYGGPGAASWTKEAVEAVAQQIVTAVNCHDDLLAACEQLVQAFESPTYKMTEMMTRFTDARDAASAAIAKAKNTTP